MTERVHSHQRQRMDEDLSLSFKHTNTTILCFHLHHPRTLIIFIISCYLFFSPNTKEPERKKSVIRFNRSVARGQTTCWTTGSEAPEEDGVRVFNSLSGHRNQSAPGQTECPAR